MNILNGQNPTIFGDGEQSRDFTYVSNVVEANILASKAEDVSGEVFDIACGEMITVNSLASQINEIIGTAVKPNYDSPRPGDIRHSLADISKAREMLKYKPRVKFRDGLEKTILYYMERK
jgi:nucleoside-diphosphate-sugar epimerase